MLRKLAALAYPVVTIEKQCTRSSAVSSSSQHHPPTAAALRLDDRHGHADHRSHGPLYVGHAGHGHDDGRADGGFTVTQPQANRRRVQTNSVSGLSTITRNLSDAMRVPSGFNDVVSTQHVRRRLDDEEDSMK